MKIRKAGKTESLEITIDAAMKGDGYVEGAIADWIKDNGVWTPKLRSMQVGAKPEVQVEAVVV